MAPAFTSSGAGEHRPRLVSKGQGIADLHTGVMFSLPLQICNAKHWSVASIDTMLLIPTLGNPAKAAATIV